MLRRISVPFLNFSLLHKFTEIPEYILPSSASGAYCKHDKSFKNCYSRTWNIFEVGQQFHASASKSSCIQCDHWELYRNARPSYPKRLKQTRELYEESEGSYGPSIQRYFGTTGSPVPRAWIINNLCHWPVIVLHIQRLAMNEVVVASSSEHYKDSFDHGSAALHKTIIETKFISSVEHESTIAI